MAQKTLTLTIDHYIFTWATPLPLSASVVVLYGWSLVSASASGRPPLTGKASAPIWPVAPLTESAATSIGQQGGSAEDEEEGEIEPHLDGDVFLVNFQTKYLRPPFWIWENRLSMDQMYQIDWETSTHVWTSLVTSVDVFSCCLK